MKKGFTLVELIVVVIIIGILAAVGIPQYRKALERARGAEMSAGLGHIQEAEKIFFAYNQTYFNTTNNAATTPMLPADQSTLDINLPQDSWYFNITSTGSTGFIATAMRRSGMGPCGATPADRRMTINETGNFTGTGWRDCVNGL